MKRLQAEEEELPCQLLLTLNLPSSHIQGRRMQLFFYKTAGAHVTHCLLGCQFKRAQFAHSPQCEAIWQRLFQFLKRMEACDSVDGSGLQFTFNLSSLLLIGAVCPGDFWFGTIQNFSIFHFSLAIIYFARANGSFNCRVCRFRNNLR